jgi:hypothetical protein
VVREGFTPILEPGIKHDEKIYRAFVIFSTLMPIPRQCWLGFNQFCPIYWFQKKITALESNKILVEYTYSLHSNIALLYPINLLFAHSFWKTYMTGVGKFKAIGESE